jgi:hypothetical protein
MHDLEQLHGNDNDDDDSSNNVEECADEESKVNSENKHNNSNSNEVKYPDLLIEKNLVLCYENSLKFYFLFFF